MLLNRSAARNCRCFLLKAAGESDKDESVMIIPLSCTPQDGSPGVPNRLLRSCGRLPSRLVWTVGSGGRRGSRSTSASTLWSGFGWRSDLDCQEGEAAALAAELARRCSPDRLCAVQEYGAFGTVALQLDGIPLTWPRLAGATRPAENPVVQPGTLTADLVRRDFTINAMAFDLVAVS